MVGAQSWVKQEFLMKSLAGSGQGRICYKIRRMTLRFIKTVQTKLEEKSQILLLYLEAKKFYRNIFSWT